jgi:hypothetical protein
MGLEDSIARLEELFRPPAPPDPARVEERLDIFRRFFPDVPEEEARRLVEATTGRRPLAERIRLFEDWRRRNRRPPFKPTPR